MKKLLIILALFPLGLMAQDKLYDSIVVSGSDTVMWNSIADAADLNVKLINVDFPISKNKLPANSRCFIDYYGLQIPLAVLNSEGLRNYARADTFYVEQSNDSVLSIAVYDTPTDVNSQYNVIPEPTGVIKVPTDFADLNTAISNVSPGDTIETYEYTDATDTDITKDITIRAVALSTMTGDLSHNSVTSIDYEITGLYYNVASTSIYVYNTATSAAGSSATLNNIYFQAGDKTVFMSNANSPTIEFNNCIHDGVARIAYSTAVFNNCRFLSNVGTTLRKFLVSDNADITINDSYFQYNSNLGDNIQLTETTTFTINNSVINGAVNTSGNPLSCDLTLNNCEIYANGEPAIFDNDLVNVYIDSCTIDSSSIAVLNAELSITNSTLSDFEIRYDNTSVNRSVIITGNTYTANDSSLIKLENSIPTVNNNNFDIDNTYWRLWFVNDIVNGEQCDIKNNQFDYNVEPIDNICLYVNNTDATRFDNILLEGNIFNMSRVYGSETVHHTVLIFNSSTITRYNYFNGGTTNHVVKSTLGSAVSDNIIYGNIFYNCKTPIYLRTQPNSLIYNNTFKNDNSNSLRQLLWIDDDGGAGVNSDSCQFINNIVDVPNGYYYDFKSTLDTVGFISSNNILYNSDSINIDGAYIDYATWTGLGYDQNSYNTDPNFKSDSQLWPTQPSDALLIGNTQISPSEMLDTVSVWPDAINTIPTGYFVDAGAYKVSPDFTVDTVDWGGVDAKWSDVTGKINSGIEYIDRDLDEIILGVDSLPSTAVKINAFIREFEIIENDTIIYGTDPFSTWTNKYNAPLKLLNP